MPSPEKPLKNLLTHTPDLARRIIVFEVDDLVGAAGFVFNEELTIHCPDGRYSVRVKVDIAVTWQIEDVPDNPLASYVPRALNLRSMDVDQTRAPVVFDGLD